MISVERVAMEDRDDRRCLEIIAVSDYPGTSSSKALTLRLSSF